MEEMKKRDLRLLSLRDRCGALLWLRLLCRLLLRLEAIGFSLIAS